VRLALIAQTGEMGYPSVLTAKTWVSMMFLQGKRLQIPKGVRFVCNGNVLFKISFPAEFHSQTAIEAAMTLNRKLKEAGKQRMISKRSLFVRMKRLSVLSTKKAR